MTISDLNSCAEVETLLPAFVEHSLPATSADQVAAHVATCAGCQLQAAQLRALTADLDGALPEVPLTALRANFMAMLAQEKAALQPEVAAAPTPSPPAAKVVSMWPTAVVNHWMRIAAAVVLIAGGVFVGRNLPGSATGAGGYVATSDPSDQPATSQRLAQALAGTNKQPVSASDRIQLVNTSGAEQEPSDATVQVLINTLNFDASPNVRLAAAEALFRLRTDPRVGEAFVHSLPIQTDPNVQITLIELLVALRDPRAVPSLERLARRRDALPVVRKQAEAGLGKLI